MNRDAISERWAMVFVARLRLGARVTPRHPKNEAIDNRSCGYCDASSHSTVTRNVEMYEAREVSLREQATQRTLDFQAIGPDKTQSGTRPVE